VDYEKEYQNALIYIKVSPQWKLFLVMMVPSSLVIIVPTPL
jgi:hypothetical protein